MANYIGVGTEVDYYPTADTLGTGDTVTSGSLTSLQAQDGVYMVVAANTSGAHSTYMMQYTTTIGYPASQILGWEVDYVAHISALTNYPSEMLWALIPWSGNYDMQLSGPTLGTTDQTFQWVTKNVDPYIGSDGTAGYALCVCNSSGDANTDHAYSISSDLLRWRVYLVPGGGGAAPVANFSGTPTSGAAPLAVSFTDSSTNTPTSWSWNFGDSNTSTAHNPSHTYTSTGTYTVALTATNSYGQNTNTKNNYIGVGNPPVANFSGTPTSGAAPLAVTFTDSSTNSPTAWSWTFGDSAISTVQNPSHSYTGGGTYTVALTATNAYGQNTNTKTNYITVTGGSAPVANFSGTPPAARRPWR